MTDVLTELEPADPDAAAVSPPTRRPYRRVLALLAVGAVAVGVVVAVAVPSSVYDPSGLDGSVLAEFSATEPVEITAEQGSDVQYARVTLAPDSWMGWHEHDGYEFVAVAAGQVVSYMVDGDRCAKQRYDVGQGIVEHPHHVHNMYNPGPAPLVLYVTSVTPAHEHVSANEPRPANCPVGGSS